MEKAMAPHSSTLAWKTPWTEEPGGLQSMGSLRIGHDWTTSFSLFTSMHWRRKWQPTPVFLPGESQGWGAWWAAVYEVAQSWTRLKRLSSSSSSGSQGFPGGAAVNNPSAIQETGFRSLGWKDPLEEGVSTHSSTLAWRIPWTEEPSGLQSIGLQSQTRLKRLSRQAVVLKVLSYLLEMQVLGLCPTPIGSDLPYTYWIRNPGDKGVLTKSSK